METQTIVLVLVSLCGGGALVMLASAYRSIGTKVDVKDYELEKKQKEIEAEKIIEGFNRELEELRANFSSRIDELACEDDKLNKRIDSRADKLHQIFAERIREL